MVHVPGTILFTHRDSMGSKAIAFGQKIRMRGEDAKYAHWSHVALVVKTDCTIVEALSSGVVLSDGHKYAGTEHRLLVPRGLNAYNQANVVTFAMHAVGREYGWVEDACLGLYLASGTKLRIGIDGQMICSGLVAGALSRTDAIFPEEPMFMTPGGLAKYYDAP